MVEKAQDIFALERSRYRGLYHVLQGVISPLDGVGPQDIKIQELLKRIKSRNIDEVVIALNPSVEGDATTMFMAQELEKLGVKVSRLARGVPAGASIDYIDDTTLCRALEERQKVM